MKYDPARARELGRTRRRRRTRKKVWGTKERPRLSVFRSHKHIYCQVIDDDAEHTLAAVSSMAPEVREQAAGKKKSEIARIVGAAVARRCLEKGIQLVVFDRGGYKYHGRVKALADGARESGLRF